MSTPKLPVLATVGQAYSAVRAQSPLLGQIAARWGIAAGVALALGVLLVQRAPPEQFPAAERAAAMTSLAMLILGIGAYVIIVRWHRLVVQNLSAEQTRRGAVGSGILYFARAMLLTALGLTVALIGSLLPIALTRDFLNGETRWYLAVALAVLVTAALASPGEPSGRSFSLTPAICSRVAQSPIQAGYHLPTTSKDRHGRYREIRTRQ